MKPFSMLALTAVAAFSFVLAANPATAQIVITEVSSSNSIEDWFELTNTGDTTVDLTGYYWDDNGENGDDGSLFTQILIAPGESIIVLQDSELIDGVETAFRDIYSLDASVQVITEDDIVPLDGGLDAAGEPVGDPSVFTGSQDLFSGLSSNGDEISLWDADPNDPANAGEFTLLAFVEFPAAPDPEFDENAGSSFDFSSGFPVLSVVGVDGAVLATNGDVGSPGFSPLGDSPALTGDFEPDGDVDADDIDFYSGNIGEEATGDLAQLDFVNDGLVTVADYQFHIENFVQTSNGQVGTIVGDINLDGTVDVLGDAFLLVGGLGLTSGASYADGDLNADGAVDVLGDAFVLVGNLGLSNEE